VCDAKGRKTAGPKIAQPGGDPMAAMMNPAMVQSPAFTADGKIVYHAVENGTAEYRGEDGVALFKGEDLFPFRPIWLANGDLLYTADGKIKRRAGAKVAVVEFACAVPVSKPVYRKKARDYDGGAKKPVVGIGSPALSPDGSKVAFRALNALYVMPIGGAPKAIVNDGYWVCDPAWSPNGETLAYSTDRAGKLDIWLRDMATGAERQLTHFKDAAVSSAWSKDGTQIAFLSQTGALNRVDVASGAITEVFGPLWEPGKPTWSADGKTIAYAAFKPYSARFREGLSEILTVDVASGVASYQPVFPDRSFGTRGDDGPFWSADGKKMVFVFASRLYVANVDPKGRMTGPPKLINDELTDAPTWDAQAKQILYLSGGKLRMIGAEGGGPPKTIPHQLTWAVAKPKDKLVVRAGQLWQGLGPEMLTKVDIISEDGWIKDIVPAGQARMGEARLIDASDATVIPGLVEMHAHRQMQGYGYGDRDGRLWLSLGVTTARSPGSPAYHMVEDKEALDAGLRVGPRYFSTGEAIDGGRTYYNFMRPVSEPGQMALELERAKALGYDMMKSYVRLPLNLQKELIDWAHGQGLHVSGHYHYPAIHFGADGMEHIGATSRLGYSRTVTALGASYQDITAIFVQSGARRTPTLFQASALYGQDRSLVDDRRTRALYPPWEYAKLTGRADSAAKGDNTVVLKSLERSVEHVKAIVRNGGRITTGTDSPIDLNGVSLHMNLRAMVMFGMTPYEALITATRYSAEYLDQPFGVVAPGMLADMVVSNGDPLSDIKAAADVRYTIKNGEVFDIPTLVAPFEGKAQASVEAASPVRLARMDDQHWWHTAEYVEDGRAACCVDPMCRPLARGVRRTFMAVEV
ncbi:MAG: amidohydrolase, partial [Caulobacteraceae bacterium]|nr:amidohydrolase [Caulobacteraceae bacterium]